MTSSEKILAGIAEDAQNRAAEIISDAGKKAEEAVKERILQLCIENNISINKLCSLSGVTQSTVNNIVSGRNRSTTISTIKKLCDGLGITIEDFFTSELFRNLEQEVK